VFVWICSWYLSAVPEVGRIKLVERRAFSEADRETKTNTSQHHKDNGRKISRIELDLTSKGLSLSYDIEREKHNPCTINESRRQIASRWRNANYSKRSTRPSNVWQKA
jgi:hypothetical protein